MDFELLAFAVLLFALLQTPDARYAPRKKPKSSVLIEGEIGNTTTTEEATEETTSAAEPSTTSSSPSSSASSPPDQCPVVSPIPCEEKVKEEQPEDDGPRIPIWQYGGGPKGLLLPIALALYEKMMPLLMRAVEPQPERPEEGKKERRRLKKTSLKKLPIRLLLF